MYARNELPLAFPNSHTWFEFYKASTHSPNYDKVIEDGDNTYTFHLHDVTMVTYRRYYDGRDIMNDTYKPQWVAEDKFDVVLYLYAWKNNDRNRMLSDTIAKYSIKTDDTNLINQIYYNVKHGTRYWDIITALRKMDGIEVKREEI